MQIDLAPARGEALLRNVHIERAGALTWSLKWRLSSTLFYLVVEAPLGGRVDIDQEVVDALRPVVLQGAGGNEIYLSSGRSCALYLDTPRRERHIDYKRSHARYGVYCCGYDRDEDRLTIYVPQSAADASCDVPGSVSGSITPHTVTKSTGLFRRKTETRREGFLMEIHLDSKPASGEQLGVWYEFPGSSFRYPILPEMDGKTLYVKSPTGRDDPPVIKSSGTGYVVVEKRP